MPWFSLKHEACNITYRLLIIALFSDGNITTAQIESVLFIVSACIIS